MGSANLRWVETADEKESICRSILTQLPEWFGIPESTEEYCLGCRSLDMVLASREGAPVGFAATRVNSPATVELYVLGVLKNLHRSGIGTAMLEAIEDHSRTLGFRLLEVKTLGSGRESAEYERTRGFYEGRGFFRLETLTEIWGTENPCLILVKPLDVRS